MVQGAGNVPGNEITIDGPHRGNVRADVVRIAQGGSVVGNIVARVVKVSGRLEGVVDSKEFYASATARVRGVIRHELIGLMPGAAFSATAERVAFTAFDAAEESVVDASPVAVASPPAEASPQDLPFRPGPNGAVWVPPAPVPAAAAAETAVQPVLTDERRARMMENVKAALADVAAGLTGITPVPEAAGDERVPQPAPARRVLPSLLG